MRVLHVFEPEVGGVPKYVIDLVRLLRERGVEIDIAGPQTQMQRFGDRYTVLFSPARSRLNPLAMVSALGKIVRLSRDYDLVHAHSSVAGFLAAIANIFTRRPTIYTPHSWSFQRDISPSAKQMYRRIERLIATRYSSVVTVSMRERDEALAHSVVPENRISTVATGSDYQPSQLDRNEARTKIGLGVDDFVVGWVGRLDPSKRPEDLAKVQSHLSGRATVAALGTGLQGSDAGDELARAGGVVVDSGIDPGVLYRAADLFLLTSQWEALPLTLLEASRSALPTVSYDAGDIRHLIDSCNCGYVVPVGDVSACTKYVSVLIEQSDLLHELGQAALENVSIKYSVESMAAQFMSRYQTVLRASMS